MPSLRKLLRRAPSALALIFYVATSVVIVMWVVRELTPADWTWFNAGRSSMSRSKIRADFSSGVGLITGAFYGLQFYTWSHGPLKFPFEFPRFATGLWVLALSCIEIVPFVENVTSMSAKNSPLSFIIWIILSIAWAMFCSRTSKETP